ncbi:MAG: phosphoribosylaminoimidazolesuccinocarboxamide synthase [bacterium]|nr:phosphoribosylaminoimidazolesuccinocarboxamide synthase [bacterium]
MEKRNLLYEGKAKKLWATDHENKVVQQFKDSLTAQNGQKTGSFHGKGAINCEMSTLLFNYLDSHHIPTHFIESVSETEMVVRKLEMFPMEVVVRNIAAGSMCKRYNIAEGNELSSVVLEYYYKSDALGDPMMNESHALSFGFATIDQIRAINRMATKINALLRSHFERRNLMLVDMKLEFGKYDEEVYLADEISPDTMRVWEKNTKVKLDKDRFRLDLGEIDKGYREILKRIKNEG